MSILKNSNRKIIQTLSFEKSYIFESEILKNMSVKNIHILPKNKLSLNHIKPWKPVYYPHSLMRAVLGKYTNMRNHTLMTFTITKILQIPFYCNYIIIPKHLPMLNGPTSKELKTATSTFSLQTEYLIDKMIWGFFLHLT